MELVLSGYLTPDRNPDMLLPGVSLGCNEVKHLVLTVFDDEIVRLKAIIASYNKPSSPISQHYSFPTSFMPDSCHVKLKIRAAKSDSLMKLIDWSSSLLKTPIQNWIGEELSIKVRLSKYNFSMSSGAPDEEILAGGASTKHRGVSFQIQSIQTTAELLAKVEKK